MTNINKLWCSWFKKGKRYAYFWGDNIQHHFFPVPKRCIHLTVQILLPLNVYWIIYHFGSASIWGMERYFNEIFLYLDGCYKVFLHFVILTAGKTQIKLHWCCIPSKITHILFRNFLSVLCNLSYCSWFCKQVLEIHSIVVVASGLRLHVLYKFYPARTTCSHLQETLSSFKNWLVSGNRFRSELNKLWAPVSVELK